MIDDEEGDIYMTWWEWLIVGLAGWAIISFILGVGVGMYLSRRDESYRIVDEV